MTSVQRTALCLAGIFLFIYVPDIGHGLVRDDFGWIRHSRLGHDRTLTDLFQANVGFYRPLVMVSFAIDYAIWGTRPFGYALTNLLMAGANAALIFVLARRLALPASAALVAAAVWALNFHGINVSLLWLSGRTALMVTMFALLAAIQFARRRSAMAAVCSLLAMLCKEEAVVVPALFTAVAFFEEGGARHPVDAFGKAVRRAWPVWLALAIYFPMRFNSGAFGAASAPAYYTFSLSPSLVLKNLGEYTDRAGTVAAVVALMMAMVGGLRGRLDDAERRALLWAALWIPSALALTLFLPVRSSLYVILPSVGTALVAGAIASRATRLAPQRFTRVAVGLVLVALVCVPTVYRSRNQRMVREASLASQTMAVVNGEAARHTSGGTVAFIDNRSAPTTFEASFGGAIDDAVVVMTGSQWRGVPWSADSPLSDEVSFAVRLQDDGAVVVGRSGP